MLINRHTIQNMKFTIETASEHLKENWSNINSIVGFLGVGKIYELYEKVLTHDQIRAILSTFESYSLLSIAHQSKKSNPTIANHKRDVMQIDYVHISELAEYNDGIKYLFCAIDVFTKRAWCIPTIQCNADSSIESMMVIFNTLQTRPKTILSDGGPEFNNKKFRGYLREIGVNIIFSESNQKASTVERFQRTLERKIYIFITEFEKLRYIDVLSPILSTYNRTKHSFLKYTPLQVETSREIHNDVLIKHALKFYNIKRKSPKFKIGDIVRIATKKTAFHRSYNIQRTYERFKINEIVRNLPIPRYRLVDELNTPIEGFFLDFEMIKVKLDKYRANIIQKRVRNKRKEYLLKFKGYSDRFNLWQTKSASDPHYFT